MVGIKMLVTFEFQVRVKRFQNNKNISIAVTGSNNGISISDW